MYGDTYNDATGGINFKPGINDDVYLTGFELRNIETSKYNGKVLDVIWTRQGSEIKERKFPINPENINKTDRHETKEEAVKEAFANFNSFVKHVITGYVSEDDFTAKTKGAKSFEEFVNAAKSLLPDNFKEIKGSLIVGYDHNDYLSVPGFLWVTGHFWKPQTEFAKDKELVVGKRIKMSPSTPQTAGDSISETPEADTEW